ncbi:hypothetical protein B0H13DRAFT_2336691 [Mycena leptocephala]|nr:hypothetical protein B0H13DRAFT_2336691 [Mycena leptocephala]
MSTRPRTPSKPRLVPTNLRSEDVVWGQRGVKDSRYYCLPPDHTTPGKKKRNGGYPFHLVSQGHVVGIFDEWLEAKASLTGFPDGSNRGYDSKDECITAWQTLCPLGIHLHPVDPNYLILPTASASAFVNTSPRKSAHRGVSSAVLKHGASPVKREVTPGPSGEGNAKLLADLKRYCSPIRDDKPRGRVPPPATAPGETGDLPFINFAIRGGGIISSSPECSEQRFRELQRRGEQPDMLVTRSFPLASLFALEEEELEGE